MKEELRATTKNQRSFDSAVMMSSLMPSEKYSCAGSPLMLMKGSTAIAGRSGSGRVAADVSRACGPGVPVVRPAATSPTKRIPLRATVRISRCSSPLSSIARRTALMRLDSVESETTRPFQMASSRSSRVTTRSRLRIR